MNASISGSHFIRAQAAMLQLALGLVLVGYAMASHAAQANAAAPAIDLISIPPAYSFTRNDRAAGLDANDRLPDRFGFAGMPYLPQYMNLKNVASSVASNVASWVASTRRYIAGQDNPAPPSTNLNVGSKETFILIKPIDRSITMMWHRKLD
jgi:hypothetical protein